MAPMSCKELLALRKKLSSIMFDEIIKHLKGPGLNRSAQFPHFPVERLASNSR